MLPYKLLVVEVSTILIFYNSLSSSRNEIITFVLEQKLRISVDDAHPFRIFFRLALTLYVCFPTHFLFSIVRLLSKKQNMIVEPNDVLIHMYKNPGQLKNSYWITIYAPGFNQYFLIYLMMISIYQII